jgi:hypothetical protein
MARPKPERVPSILKRLTNHINWDRDKQIHQIYSWAPGGRPNSTSLAARNWAGRYCCRSEIFGERCESPLNPPDRLNNEGRPSMPSCAWSSSSRMANRARQKLYFAAEGRGVASPGSSPMVQRTMSTHIF